MFDPRSGLLNLTHYVQILRPYQKYIESKFKKCFHTHGDIWIKSPARTPCKSKNVFLAPPPLIQTEAEPRRREAVVQQSMKNGLESCMFICLYVWLLQISGDLKHRASPKWYHEIATCIIHCLGMFLAPW